ncbi:OmpA family protein [Azohydromonas australica]|uniref:OmpA family protein n=1 Tax=Azohydromonas australica TaxID=364039 RepID=UPI0004142ACF|nr:OmpA family protein [Azohydromonas australica]
MTGIFLGRSGAGLLLLCATLLAACTSARQPASPPPAALARQQAPALHPRIVQQDFGRDATFTTCLPPDCPVRTTKVLATEPPAETPVALDGLAAGLDEHETVLLPSSTAPSPAPAGPPAGPAPGEPQSLRATVLFASGSATLDPSARQALDQLASRVPAARSVLVSGHTDGAGPAQVNQALARARADAVAAHLRQRQPQLASAIRVEARGACCLAAPDDTADGRRRNRRVEILVERQEAGP